MGFTPRRAATSLFVTALMLAGGVVSAEPATAFVPPVYADASPNGPAVTVAFIAPGQRGSVWFMGLAGQTMSLDSEGTFAAPCDLELQVLTANDSAVTIPLCAGTTTSAGLGVLPVNGMYKVSLIAGTAGSIRISLTSTGPIASITPNAPRIRLAVTTPHQKMKLGFVAQAGERYSAISTNGTVAPSCRVAMAIVDRAGHHLSTRDCIGAPSTGFIDAIVIPTDGVYYLRVSERDGSVVPASFHVKLFRVTDLNRSILADGTLNSIKFTMPGQRALLHFAGTTGQHVSVVLPDYAIGDGCFINLIRPDGSQLAQTSCFVIHPSFLDQTTLDTTGDWTVIVDPDAEGPSVGTITAQVFTVTDIDEPITVGQSQTVSFTTPGQNAVLRFPGATDDRLTLDVTNISMPDGYFAVAVKEPDGYILDGVQHGYIGAHFDIVLDETGTYAVLVDPGWAQTGDISVTLSPTFP